MVRRRRIRPRRKQRPRKTRRSRRKNTSSTFGNIIVQGTRTLLSLLPGSEALKSLADTTFKSLGLATNVEYHNNHVTVTSAWYGCVSASTLRLANIVSRAPIVVREISKHADSVNKIQFSTPLVDGRLINLSITCRPDTKISDRRGKWGMCYVPFRNPKDKETARASFKTITLVELAAMPYSMVGPADKTLSVQFNPTARDGAAFGYLPMDEDMGLLVVVFTLENREDYSKELNSNNFAPNITVKGKVVCGQPLGGEASSTFVDELTPVITAQFLIHGAPFDSVVGFEDCTLLSPNVLSIPREHFEKQTGLNNSLSRALTQMEV